ncbi:predicted protein [Postia placenta Mad-698-R]|nr:predicted protein [Postia placenta Mad-698-R]
MGVAQSVGVVVYAVVAIAHGIFKLVTDIQRAHSAGEIAANPVMEEIEERMRKEREAQWAKLEEDRRQIQESKERAQEAEGRAKEAEGRAKEAEGRAKEAQKMAEEAARWAAEEAGRMEESRRRAEGATRAMEEAKRIAEEKARRIEKERIQAEEARHIAEENAGRVEKERALADEARLQAEADARRNEEARRQAEEDRKQAEQKRKQAEEEAAAAEESRRRAEEDGQRSERERAAAEEQVQQAKHEQDKAEAAEAVAKKLAQDAIAAAEEAKEALKEGIKPVILPSREEYETTKKRLEYKDGFFHFAVAGISGSGKSSLINAFRGMRNNSRDPLVAETGITETTSRITRYEDPNKARPFVWYDVPGAGTLKVPDWAYFNDQGLYVFDCIIVLTDNRFTATDMAILRNCALFQIPSYIVRSKSAQQIRNVLNDMPCDEDAGENKDARKDKAIQQYVAETRRSVAQNLEKAGLPQQRVYIVDKETLVKIANGGGLSTGIDEWELIGDLLSTARDRRIKPKAFSPVSTATTYLSSAASALTARMRRHEEDPSPSSP